MYRSHSSCGLFRRSYPDGAHLFSLSVFFLITACHVKAIEACIPAISPIVLRRRIWLHAFPFLCICVYACVRVCACMNVRENERNPRISISSRLFLLLNCTILYYIYNQPGEIVNKCGCLLSRRFLLA